MKTYILYIIGLIGLMTCLALSIRAGLLWPSAALGVALLWLCLSLYGRIGRLLYAYRETEKENEHLHTRLVEAERQLQYLRQLTENVDTALFVCTTDGRIDWMNHAATLFSSPSGLSPVKFPSLTGEGLGERPGNLPPHILSAIAEHKEVVDGCALSTVLLRIDGRRRLIVALKDVSMLMQQQEMEACWQLIRVLTHEIMNSLTPIISISETLADSLPLDGGQEGAAVINRRCHALLDFVESYRQLTRIKQPERTQFPVADLFAHIKALYSLSPGPSPVGEGSRQPAKVTCSPSTTGEESRQPAKVTCSPSTTGEVSRQPPKVTFSPSPTGEGSRQPAKVTFSPSPVGEGSRQPAKVTFSPSPTGEESRQPAKVTFSPSTTGEGSRQPAKVTCSPSTTGEGSRQPAKVTFSPSPTGEGQGERLSLFADRSQIEQVLINLIKNAYESGATEVELTASETLSNSPLKGENSLPLREGRGGSVICVRDNGCGMSPDVLAQAFIPFFTTKQAGTGIGLALCRQIILKHGGTITIDSEEGRGTTFTISLPKA